MNYVHRKCGHGPFFFWSPPPLPTPHPAHAHCLPVVCHWPHCLCDTQSPCPGKASLSSAYRAFSMCFEEIVTLLCSDIHHNVSTAEASGRFYFSDNDQLLFPVLKTKVEQMQRSSVFILTMQELHYIFAITPGHYLSTCPFFFNHPLNCLHLLIVIFLSL